MLAIFKHIKRFFKYISLDFKLRKAVLKADFMASQTGDTYFVLPTKWGGITVLTWHEYRKLYFKGQATKANLNTIYRECFYCTRWKHLARLPKVGIRAKRKMYFDYYLQ